MEFLNTMWVEKYRPRKLDDLVLPEEYYNIFKNYIGRKEVGNFLFHGPPGGGKTVLSRIICSKNGSVFNREDNVLEINGSAQETRGITFVNDVVEPFLKVPPAGQDKYRIVFIDEADYLTPNSFSSLRGVISKYSERTGRFIFTCNYLSKIPEPIQSRFQLFPFKQLPIDFVSKYCSGVLTSEKVEFDEKDLKFVVDNLYPDVRLIINTLQRSSISGKLKVNREFIITTEKKILSFIVEIISSVEKNENYKIGKSVESIMNLLDEKGLEFRNLYMDLFFKEKLPIPVKLVVNKFANSHSSCLVPQMHVMAMIYEIIKILQDYKRSLLKK